MASMLLNIIKIEEPDAMIICFDEGDETFRHEEAEDYKEGRAETPDDFYDQIPRVMELIEKLGIKQVSDPQYEADDFLCSYAMAAVEKGMKVTIVTGDRDALQLASDKITIAIPHKGYQQTEYLGPAEIEAKYGIRPDQVVSYKGLIGDSSDNLPGVHGIGPKTGSKLLQDYDTLEGVYEHLDDIKPTVSEKLARDREQAFFCQKMAQLVCDIPLPVPLDKLRLKNLPLEPLISFLQEMEFTLIAKRLQAFLKTDYGARVFDAENAAIVIPEPVTPKKKSDDQLSLFS